MSDRIARFLPAVMGVLIGRTRHLGRLQDRANARAEIERVATGARAAWP